MYFYMCNVGVCCYFSALRISITVFNIDDTFYERESPAAMATITTLPVGPPQVPDRPTVTDVTNSSATVTWNNPGNDVCMCVCVCDCV